MIPTLDKVRLDTVAQLSVETGFSMGWAPGSAQFLTKLDGWTSGAPIRRNKADLLGGHGSHAERGYRDERLVSVSGHHVAASRADAAAYVDALNAYLGDGTAGRFQVEDVNLGTRWAEVYLAAGATDVTWTGGVDVGYTVHMLAADPRKYGAAVLYADVGVPVAGSGLTFPLFGSPAPGVLNLGGGGYPGKVTTPNPGTADVGPVFRVTADYAPGFTITETGTGRRLVYVETVVDGQTITLDSNDGTATLDGYAPRDTKLVTAEWTRLAPGSPRTWLFESPGSTNARLSVEVTPAWW